MELKALEEKGEIHHLKLKETYPLQNQHIAIRELRGEKVRSYTPDFVYCVYEKDDVRRVAVETKGRMEPVHSLRLSCFQALYPWIDLKVVRQNKRKKRRKAK